MFEEEDEEGGGGLLTIFRIGFFGPPPRVGGGFGVECKHLFGMTGIDGGSLGVGDLFGMMAVDFLREWRFGGGFGAAGGLGAGGFVRIGSDITKKKK